MTRRRWWLAGLLAFCMLVRMALPEVIRRQAEARVSELLHARVHIGDVDLGILRGAVALDDVALRPPLPADAAADAAEAEPAEPPVLAWHRLAVNLSWWPLVHKVVQFSSVELDEPRVALDRLADGELNLLALVPAVAGEAPKEETPGTEAAPAPAKGTPWGVGIDHLVLRAGHVRFRDFAVQEQSEPVDVRLPTIEVRNIALAPGLYGGPARTSIDVRVDEGRLRVSTHVWLREGGGVGLATTLRARRMPLKRARLYVPAVGWRELEGELGASLVHHLESKGRNLVRGTVSLDGVAVHVPEVETPALTWKHLGIAIAALDLEAHRAQVDTVELAGATVVVRPEGGDLLPAIARKAGEAAEKAREDEAAAPPTSAPAAAPWRWSVGTARVSEALIHVLSDQGQRDYGVGLEMRQLAGDGEQPAPTKLDVTADTASLSIEGGARIAAPGFDGTLTLKDLRLPEVPVVAGRLRPSVLQDGRLSAALRLAAGSAATPAGDVTVTGTIELAAFALLGADPNLFAVAFDRLALGIDELRVPGALAPAGGERKPPIVKLASLELAKPRVQLTRTPEGLVLPAFSGPPVAAAPAADAAPSPPASPSPAADTAPSPPASPSPAAESTREGDAVDLTVGTLAVQDGEVRVTDQTVKPFFSGGLSDLDIDVRALRYPALAMENLKLTATSLTRGRLEVTGRFGPAGGRVEVNGKDIALEPFNPYATHYSPYSIAGGALSITSKATMKGGAYDSTTALKLDRFDLGGKEGDSLFTQQFGIPIEVALALLRDIQGRIAFDIPVAGDQRGTKVSVMTVAGQALRRAILNALASPLKLVGAAFGAKGGSAAPAPIPFAIGRAQPTDEGVKSLDALGSLLASRPGIGITLAAVPTESDARWLHEQALREKMAQPQGVFGAIGNLAQRGARERVRVALEARAEGKEGPLDADDTAKLEEWLAEQPPPGEKELRALGAARLERVAAALRERNGVPAERIATRDPVTTPRPGDPVVEFDLGAARPAGS